MLIECIHDGVQDVFWDEDKMPRLLLSVQGDRIFMPQEMKVPLKGCH